MALKKKTTKVSKKKDLIDDNSGVYGLIFAIISAFLFITLCWYAYIYFVEQSTDKGIVYIKADKTPFKIITDDPGGMKNDYTEKKVFNRITGQKENLSKNVNILEQERPVDKEEIAKIAQQNSLLKEEEYQDAAKTILTPIIRLSQEEDEKEEIEQVETFDDLVALVNDDQNDEADPQIFEGYGDDDEDDVAKEEVNQDRPADNALEINQVFASISNKIAGNDNKSLQEKEEVKSSSKPSKNIPQNVKVALKPDSLLLAPRQNIIEDAKVEVEKNDKTGSNKTTITFAKAPKSLKKSSSPSKVEVSDSSKTLPGFYVQVSSHTKLQDLETAWSTFKNRFSNIVSGANKNVNEANINGTKFYRLSFGPFSDKTQAQSKCSSIKVQGRDCLIKFY